MIFNIFKNIKFLNLIIEIIKNLSLKNKLFLSLLYSLGILIAFLESKAVLNSGKIVGDSLKVIEINAPFMKVLIFTSIIALLRVFNLYLNSKITASISSDIAQNISSKMLYAPISEQNKYNSSTRFNILSTFMSRLAGATINPLLIVSVSSLSILGIVYGLLEQESKFGFFALFALISVYIIIFLFQQRIVVSLTESFRNYLIEYTEFARIISLNPKQIKGAYSEKYLIRNYSNAFTKYLEKVYLRSFLQIYPKYAIEFFAAFGLGIVFLVLFFTNQKNLILQVITGLIPFGYSAYKILPLCQQINLGVSLLNSGKKEFIYNYEWLKYELNKNPENFKKTFNKNKKPTINIKDLSIQLFNENNSKEICIGSKLLVTGINIIKGPSGCGKSSLINLLMGFSSSNYKGKIVFNLLNEKEDEKYISFIDGNPFILANSLFENITLGKKYSRELFEKVVYCSYLDDIVKEKGIDSSPYFNGNLTLSQGQCQRVGLARVLLTQSDIVCLDEIFSGIDTKVVRIILKRIKEIFPKTIFIIVGHQDFLTEISDNVLEIL